MAPSGIKPPTTLGVQLSAPSSLLGPRAALILVGALAADGQCVRALGRAVPGAIWHGVVVDGGGRRPAERVQRLHA